MSRRPSPSSPRPAGHRPAGALRRALGRLALLAWLVSAPTLALDPDKAFHHYVSDSWSIEAGLQQITVRAIAQDRDGYLWFGTQAGVARFDGVRFTTHSSADTPGLAGDFTNALLAEPDGRLWVATYKGLSLREDGRFRRIELAADPGAVLDVLSLARRDDGLLLAGSPQGVLQVQDDRLQPLHPLPGPAQSLLLEGDTLWVGSVGGVHRIDGGERRFLPLPEAGNAVVTRLRRAQGRLWAGTGIGLFWLADNGWQRYVAHPELARKPIEEIYADGDGNLWIGMLDHLLRLRDGEVVERIVHSPAAIAVRSAFEDREGNLWLGTQWSGAIRLWNGWTRRYSLREGLHDPILWSVARGPDGSTWVGSESGLTRLRDGRFELVLPGSALPHPTVYTLLPEAGRIWIGTRRGAALLEGGQLRLPAMLQPMAAAQINGIVRDRDGDLWFATTQGLFRLRDEQLQRFGEAEGLSDTRVRFVFQTREGRLLIGTQGGLFALDGDRLQPLGGSDGLPGALDVTVIQQLADGRLALGTLSDGVFVQHRGRWVGLAREFDLPSYAAFFLTTAEDGWLWVGGIRGIYRVALAELDRALVGEGKLLAEKLLNERGERGGGQRGFCCNGAGNAKGLFADGALWLPTRDGLVSLSAADVRRNLLAPTVRIERMQAAGQWRDTEAGGDWTLPPAARDLGFEYTGLSFQDPASVRLRWRLRGYDRDWHGDDDPYRRQTNYTNLPPGEYVFEVLAANNSGVWSPEPAQLPFRIQPWFHETGLFRLLATLLLASIVYAGYRLQRLKHRQQRLALEALVRQRTEALEASHRRLEEASQIDPVTGLRNRRFLANQLPADIAYYERERSRPEHPPDALVFALLGIDQFDAVRRDFGEAAAEHLLQQTAGLLGRWLRSGDYVVRWSEQEFLLVFRPLPLQHLPALGHRLCHALSQQAFAPDPAQAITLSASLGLVECPLFREARGRLGWEQIVAIAARARAYVQARGGNGWAALRPRPGQSIEQLRGLAEGDLAEAARRHDIELDCPPALRPTAPATDVH